jgi:hypothetical protein
MMNPIQRFKGKESSGHPGRPSTLFVKSGPASSHGAGRYEGKVKVKAALVEGERKRHRYQRQGGRKAECVLSVLCLCTRPRHRDRQPSGKVSETRENRGQWVWQTNERRRKVTKSNRAHQLRPDSQLGVPRTCAQCLPGVVDAQTRDTVLVRFKLVEGAAKMN